MARIVLPPFSFDCSTVVVVVVVIVVVVVSHIINTTPAVSSKMYRVKSKTSHIARWFVVHFLASGRCTAVAIGSHHRHPLWLLWSMVAPTWHWELCPQHGSLGCLLLCIHHWQLLGILTATSIATTLTVFTWAECYCLAKLKIPQTMKKPKGKQAGNLWEFIMWELYVWCHYTWTNVIWRISPLFYKSNSLLDFKADTEADYSLTDKTLPVVSPNQ